MDVRHDLLAQKGGLGVFRRCARLAPLAEFLPVAETAFDGNMNDLQLQSVWIREEEGVVPWLEIVLRGRVEDCDATIPQGGVEAVDILARADVPGEMVKPRRIAVVRAIETCSIGDAHDHPLQEAVRCPAGPSEARLAFLDESITEVLQQRHVEGF